MRELKFRLVKDNVVVGYEKHCVRVGQIHIFHSKLNDDVPGWEWCNIKILPDSFIVHDSKDQSIGIKDVNGNMSELFEGDNIDCGAGGSPIEWDEGFAGFVVNVEEDLYPIHQYIYSFKGRKTGNIHKGIDRE